MQQFFSAAYTADLPSVFWTQQIDEHLNPDGKYNELLARNYSDYPLSWKTQFTDLKLEVKNDSVGQEL